jgi:nucleoside-diphosphate-sugar epimerase
MKILITGSNGFIGKALQEETKKRGFNSVCATRYSNLEFQNKTFDLETFAVGDINAHTNWLESLSNIECVIHCASRAHVMKEKEDNPLNIYRIVNVEGTRNLAEQAAKAGVKRFVFISSIGVNGFCTNPGLHFSNQDIPAPVDDYAISKWEAEMELNKISMQTGLEVVIIRPPLVYGPGVKGNFLRLLNLVALGTPLPFGKIRNYRSFIGLDNLLDLIILCINHPKAAGQTFLASDGSDISTSDLIKKLAIAMKTKTILFHVPRYLLKIAAYFIGHHKDVDRLAYSLQVDYSHTKRMLGWIPSKSLEQGLFEMANSYLRTKKRKN